MTITRQVSDISESHKSQQQLPTSGTGVGLLWLLESQGLSVGGRAIYRLRGRGSPEEEGGVLADGALLPPAGGERGELRPWWRILITYRLTKFWCVFDYNDRLTLKSELN